MLGTPVGRSELCQKRANRKHQPQNYTHRGTLLLCIVLTVHCPYFAPFMVMIMTTIGRGSLHNSLYPPREKARTSHSRTYCNGPDDFVGPLHMNWPQYDHRQIKLRDTWKTWYFCATIILGTRSRPAKQRCVLIALRGFLTIGIYFDAI